MKFTPTARTARKLMLHGISYEKNAISAGCRFTNGGMAIPGNTTTIGTRILEVITIIPADPVCSNNLSGVVSVTS